MKDIILDQYQEWKHRQRPFGDRNVKGYHMEGLRIANELFQLECQTDRDGVGIQVQVASFRDVLREIEKMERERG